MANIKLAFRRFAQRPIVSLIAIVSLALGIGANVAIYSLFEQILVRPLPVLHPAELVNLGAPGPKMGNTSCNDAGDCDQIFSYPMFRDLEASQEVFSGLAGHRLFGANLSFDGQTYSGSGVQVTGSYFPTLGLNPALGRLLGPEDDQVVGESLVTVLGYEAWSLEFGSDPDIVGKSVIVNGHSLTIVGVAPAGFSGTTFGNRPDVYVPVTLRALTSPEFDGFEDRQAYWLYVFGRLRPEISIEQAAASLNVHYRAILEEVEAELQEGMSEATLARFVDKRITMVPGPGGQSSMREESSVPMTLLFVVAGVVLLIACANVANLMLSQAATRGGEMAVRLSVGADRKSLLTQLLSESLVLAFLGGAAGLLVGVWTLRVLAQFVPQSTPGLISLSLNLDAIVFTAALALATGLLFGLLPALHASRVDLASILRGNAGRQAGSRGANRVRITLVVAQIALSTMLLSCAGLFTRSLVNVARADLGLDQLDQVVTFSISPELNGYQPERSRALFVELEEKLAALPTVEGVTASMVPLLANSNWGSNLTVEGFESGPDTDTHSNFNDVGPGYFRTLGIPLLRGRALTAADQIDRSKVVVVNRAFAEKFDLGDDPVGKRIGQGTGNAVELDLEIVGLVADAKYSDVKDEIPPLFYRAYRQNERLGFLSFYVRTSGDPSTLLEAIPAVVQSLDPHLPVEELKSMPEQIRENTFLDRFLTTLSTSFAVVATLLAMIGLYGVLAFTIARRTREIGLRMALGADAARIRRLVLSKVAWMTAPGIVVGLIGAIGLGRAAQSLLFEVESSDPSTWLSAGILLAVVALGAGYMPTRRATRVDPMHALRDQ